MKKLIVEEKYNLKSLQNYIQKVFPHVSQNLFFKTLRKKDIKINGVRVSQNVYVHTGDVIEIYLSDELLLGKQISFESLYENKIYEDANCKLEKSTNDYTQLKKESKEFRSQLLELYKKHIELINEIPIDEEEQVELSIEEKSGEDSLDEIESKCVVDKEARKKFLISDEDGEECDNKNVFNASKVPVRKYENLKFGANYDIRSDINVK